MNLKRNGESMGIVLFWNFPGISWGNTGSYLLEMEDMSRNNDKVAVEIL